jgi:hypothetical protein
MSQNIINYRGYTIARFGGHWSIYRDNTKVDQAGTEQMARAMIDSWAEQPASEATVDSMDLPLTALDRCDRCGAQAYMRVTLESGAELLFCAHHAREHGDKLREIAKHVHDETQKLVSPA